jgi:hypothetical protein
MFWRKPLALLGFLATVSSTLAAPKEVDLEWENEDGMFFRADRYVSPVCRILREKYTSVVNFIAQGHVVYGRLLNISNSC